MLNGLCRGHAVRQDTPMTNTTCHPASAVRSGDKSGRERTGSTVKPRIRATVILAAVAMGHSDGETYVDCVSCGEPASLTCDSNDAEAFNLGHDVADADGGAYCPFCGLLPMCRACNAWLGDRCLTDTVEIHYDTRAALTPGRLADRLPKSQRNERETARRVALIRVKG